MTTYAVDTPEPSFLLQAGPADLPAALAQARQTRGSGVVLTGSEIRDVRALAQANPGLVIVADSGDWRKTLAEPSRPFAHLTTDGLFPVGIDSYVDGLAKAGAQAVLSPTCAVGYAEWESTVDSALALLKHATHPALVPFLPLQASIFDERNYDALHDKLSEFGPPVALTFLGGRDCMARGGRLDVLRRLTRAGRVYGVFATEPLISSDAMVHGAHMVAVGVGSGLRIPSMPGGGGPQSPDFEPGVSCRVIHEIHSPTRLAEMYAGRRDAPRCNTCGLDLTIYRKREHAAFIQHNVHDFADQHADLMAVPAELRRNWLATERVSALARHPLAEFKSGPNATLRRLVELDGLAPERSTSPAS